MAAKTGVRLTAAQRKKLAAARKARKLSQGAVADSIGVSQALITYCESGAKQPSRETLRAWCKALGLRVRVATTVTIE